MRASVAYRIRNGFVAITTTVSHAAVVPNDRRAAYQHATSAPTPSTPESDRTAMSPVPSTPVQTCSST